MAKKKRHTQKKTPDAINNPFRALKGFAVSEEEKKSPTTTERVDAAMPDKERSFADEMDFLGVEPLVDSPISGKDVGEVPEQCPEAPVQQSDEELFIASIGQLDAHFCDQFPEATQAAQPRRLKQLRQGRLTPDASLDLHGLKRHQVAGKITSFLQNASYHQWQTLLIVTGRGLHSATGQPVLRDEAERYLAEKGRSQVAEWARAPKQYGGDGALVVFLKNRQR